MALSHEMGAVPINSPGPTHLGEFRKTLKSCVRLPLMILRAGRSIQNCFQGGNNDFEAHCVHCYHITHMNGAKLRGISVI